MLLGLAACAPRGGDEIAAPGEAAWSAPGAAPSGTVPRILAAAAPLQCVPYAREASGIGLRGDAWTWWREAEGLYPRSSRPSIGSVLVLKRTEHLKYGHLAVVTAILSDREIVVRHANWLNRGRIHEGTPVIDVSKANDWSLVRFWYTPGHSYGSRRYPANGFILSEPLRAAL